MKSGLVTMLGAKGGVGTTFLASNLGAVVAESAAVCVADMDFCKGDLGTYIDVEAPPLIATLIGRDGALDDDTIKRSVVRHKTGFDALCQPHDLTSLQQVSRDDVTGLLQGLRKNFGLVIADLGSRVDVSTLTAILSADMVVVVTTNTVPSLRNTRRLLKLIEELKIPSKAVHIVVNRFMRDRVSAQEIKNHLGRKASVILDEDSKASKHTNLVGTLAVSSDQFLIARQIREMWQVLQGLKSPSKHSPWPWARSGVSP